MLTFIPPLRCAASAILGKVAAARAKLDGAWRSLAIEKEAADFLIWTQGHAGSGVYPLLAARGTSKARAMQVATRFITKAEKASKRDSVIHNRWAFDDAGTGVFNQTRGNVVQRCSNFAN